MKQMTRELHAEARIKEARDRDRDREREREKRGGECSSLRVRARRYIRLPHTHSQSILSKSMVWL